MPPGSTARRVPPAATAGLVACPVAWHQPASGQLDERGLCQPRRQLHLRPAHAGRHATRPVPQQAAACWVRPGSVACVWPALAPAMPGRQPRASGPGRRARQGWGLGWPGPRLLLHRPVGQPATPRLASPAGPGRQGRGVGLAATDRVAGSRGRPCAGQPSQGAGHGHGLRPWQGVRLPWRQPTSTASSQPQAGGLGAGTGRTGGLPRPGS